MVKGSLVIALLLFHSFCFAQVYNAEKKLLEQSFSTDPRIQVKFYSTLRNTGGYEGTSLLVKNLSDKTLFVEIRLHITDNCGAVITRNIKATIRAGEKIGGNTWMGGSEQFDYNSSCESTKYGEWQYSKIKKATIDVDGISETGKQGGSGNGENTGNGNGGNTDGGGGPVGGSGNQIAAGCPLQDLSISNGPSMNCVQLRWIRQSTIQYNEKSGEIRTDKLSEQFILSYKKAADLYWKELKLSYYQMGYNLTGLDPCTSYEVKLQRVCDNNMRSDYSNTIQFTTGCPVPGSVKADQISKTSAQISSMFSPGVNVCSAQRPAYTIHIEYATPGGTWQTVISNPGPGSSMLFNLQSQTSYRVRVRYEYKTGIFSKYANEINFKTY